LQRHPAIDERARQQREAASQLMPLRAMLLCSEFHRDLLFGSMHRGRREPRFSDRRAIYLSLGGPDDWD
jgi:hypothetical protein